MWRSHIFFLKSISSERELLVIEQLNRSIYLIWLNDFRIQRRISFLSDRSISILTRLFISRGSSRGHIIPRDIHEWEKQVTGAPHSNLHGDLEREKKNTGKRKERAAKSRWRKIAKRLDDQRSVLKSLLNLSLPSKTGHIYR